MEEDELIKEIPRNEEEGIMKSLEEDESISFKKIIILGGIIAFILIVIIIIISLSSKKSSSGSGGENENENTIYGYIKCSFQVDTAKSPTQILSKDFTQSTGVNAYINGQKLDSIYEHQFDKIGTQEVNFTVPNNFNMKNMFQGLTNLKSVHLFSEKKGKIISMESAFEDCVNLNGFSIQGFDTSELKSLKRTFMRTDMI